MATTRVERSGRSTAAASTPWMNGIEILRGVAALSVVLHHSWSLSAQPHFWGYEIVEGEVRQATAVREEKLGAVKTETAAKVASEKAEIEKQVAAAKATVAAEADKLADAIAATVIKA